MPQAFTSWESIYETLRTALDDESYHMRATLSEIEKSSSTAVSARVEGRGRIEADLLIAADGAQSATRRRLLPDVRSSYAGYVAWRGTLDEANAPPELVRFFDDAFTFSEARSVAGDEIHQDVSKRTRAPASGGSTGSGTWAFLKVSF